MAKPYAGGCACGAIRYEIDAEPMMAGHCACRDCQRMTGTGHASMMMFPLAAMKITGTPRFHDLRADSGNTASRGFCPNCGSFVMGKNSGMDGVRAIAVGSLDDPSAFRPQFIVFASRCHAWDRIDPALPSFPGMPPMGGAPSKQGENA